MKVYNIFCIFALKIKYMNKEINNNGFDYIDLGLPSGTLWAAMNVGASKSSDYGLYFQWGDTKGYDFSQIGKDKQFNWNDYKFSINGSSSNFRKYTATNATLELEDDAANFHMGGVWHMPTPKQFRELLDNTTSTWTTLDGVNGVTFTAKNDGSKFIFIPAPGAVWNGLVLNSGYTGTIWSSMLSERYVGNGQHLYFNPGYIFLSGSCGRCNGISVRGVIG